MHDMGSLGHTLQIDLTRDWANQALYRDGWRGWSAFTELHLSPESSSMHAPHVCLPKLCLAPCSHHLSMYVCLSSALLPAVIVYACSLGIPLFALYITTLGSKALNYTVHFLLLPPCQFLKYYY